MMQRWEYNLAVGFLVILFVTSCGGSPSGAVGGSIQEPVVRLSARISTSSQLSMPPPQLRFGKKDGNTPATECSIHSFNGKTYGPAETDAQGNFSVEVKAKDLADVGEVVLACGNGIQLYAPVPVSVDGTVSQSIDLGEADLDTTLAVEDLKDQIPGFSGWGQDYGIALQNIDAACLYEIHHALWKSSESDESGFTQALKELKSALGLSLTANASASKALFNGILSDSSTSVSQHELAADLSAHDTLTAVVELYVNSEGGEFLCEDITAGDLEAEVFVAPILAAGDETELVETFMDAVGAEAYINLVTGCQGQSCAKIQENAAAVKDFVKNNAKELAGSGGGKDVAGTVSSVLGAIQCCTGDKDDCQKKLAQAAKGGNGNKGNGGGSECVPEEVAEEMVLICHIPPGNPAQAHTIEVGANALAAHLAHGDTEGECVTQAEETLEDTATEPVAIDDDGAPVYDSSPESSETSVAELQMETAELEDEDELADALPPIPDFYAEADAATAAAGTQDAGGTALPVIDEDAWPAVVGVKVGDSFTSLDDLKSALQDYVWIGTFGNYFGVCNLPAQLLWPAKVVRIDEGDDTLTFKNNDGECYTHIYPGYDGYHLAAIHLQSEKGWMTFVFRSFEPRLVKLWKYEFGRVYGGFYRMIPGPSAAIGDMLPDRLGLEIATGNEEYYPFGYNNSRVSGRWFLFGAGGTVEFWKDTENDEAHSSVNLFDLTGDGTLEMIGGTTSGNQVQVFDAQAKWVWRHYLGGHHISTPAVATMPDGSLRVFSGAMDGYIRAIDGKTGALVWSYNAKQWIWSSPAVSDLDGDGTLEVVVASDPGTYWPGDGTGVLYCLDAATGQLKWQRNMSGRVRASPALADVDKDGIREVLIGGGNGSFYAFSGDTGEVEWSYKTGGEIASSAAVGDLDADGDLEIVFGSADGNVYALSGNGSSFWKTAVGSAVHSSPALVFRYNYTYQNKRYLDVYVTTIGGKLLVLCGMNCHTYGNIVAEIELGHPIVSSPTVGDVDGDGKLEIFFQDRRGDANNMTGDIFWVIRDKSSRVDPFVREWPMFRGNPQHTGVYGE